MPIIFYIFGIINISLSFLLSLRINHNTTRAVITALLLTILPWHILLIRERYLYIFLLTIVLVIAIIFVEKIKTYSKKIGVLLIVISIIIFITSVIAVPKYTNVEVDSQRTYASLTKFKSLSTAFSNKFIESYRVRESLLFQNLDFGNHFFSGHPRQRVGVKEIPKFYISLLPLLIIGIVRLNSQARWLILSTLILSIMLPVPFNDRGIGSGSLLILPVVFLSAFGLNSLKHYQRIILCLLLIEAAFFFSSFFGGYV